MKKVDDFETVYDMIEHALEFAYQGKMQLKFYEFLKYRKTKKNEVDAFLQSSTANELANEVKICKNILKEDQIMIINNCVRHMVTYQNLRQEK
tara:strand:+ start:165 stop:443 length:279 start_codon:yes stop_codon:yes gene_type:complete